MDYNTNPLRMYSFTIQDEQPGLEALLDSWTKDGLPKPMTYVKAAKESGGDTEGVHYHLFLRADKGERYSYYRDMLNVHLSDQKIYNTKQTIEYIGNPEFVYSENHSKAEKRGKKKGGECHKIWELGDVKTVRIPRPGQNTTLDDRFEVIKDLIAEGASIDELYEADFGTMIKYGKQIESYMAVYYGTAKTKQDVVDLRAKAAIRERDSIAGTNQALLQMLERLQDRIIRLES
jgi:hypothetical protein